MFDNRNVFDFRVANGMGGGQYLSMILQYNFEGTEKGFGMILNNSYGVHRKLPMRDDLGLFDIHEFNVRKDGKTALVTTYLSKEISISPFGRPNETTWLEYGGFAELDVDSAEVVHSWDCFEQIPLEETVHYSNLSPPEGHPGWDYVHINSVDKNDAGDYIISMRFTNTIYMVSGVDGRIMWRLSGRRNGEFDQDFIFSKQHDAKFLESEGTRHVISLMNNASDEEFNEEDISSALIVEINTDVTPHIARVLRRYNRPDKSLTRLRGNSQVLPNKNMFVCWSKGGYFTEFSPEGEVLMSAWYNVPRYSNYRAYKFEFTGRPETPPDVVSSVFGSDEVNLVTTIHVSWNGATDIALWNFYAQATETSARVFIGKVSKIDFESMFMAKGYMDWISVDAVDREGQVLGTSEIHRTQYPDWDKVGYSGYLGLPKPQDPTVLRQAGDRTSADGLDPSNPAEDESRKAENRKGAEILSNSYAAMRKMGGTFLLGLIVVGLFAAAVYVLLRRGWRARLYQRVSTEDGRSDERAHLRPAMD